MLVTESLTKYIYYFIYFCYLKFTLTLTDVTFVCTDCLFIHLCVIMTKSVSTMAVSSILRILTSDRKPQSMKTYLIADIKNRIENLALWSKNIFLKQCLSRGIATKEIKDLAKKTVSEGGAKQRHIREERRILRLRIQEKERQIIDSTRKIDIETRKAHKIVQLSPGLLDQFKQVRRNELGQKWEYLRDKRETRLRKIVENCCDKDKVPEKYRGVDISDRALTEMFGDPSKEPAVYGGVEITPKIREFLKLPVGF